MTFLAYVQKTTQIKEVKDANVHTPKNQKSIQIVYKNHSICLTRKDRFLQYAKPLIDTDKADLGTPFSLED